MRKISVVIPVLNEEQFLPVILENINQRVDEIVIIDGGPDGISDDNTKEIAESFDNVIYYSDVFRSSTGAWRAAQQKNTGLAKASGDIFILISADVYFSNFEILIETIQSSPDSSIFFVNTTEFWLDINHVRLTSGGNNLYTVSEGMCQAVAFDKLLQPYYDDLGSLVLKEPSPSSRMFVNAVTKYHLGWIRDFNNQVNKHVRHVKQLLWGDHGDKLLADGDQALKQWAIMHTLGYGESQYIKRGGRLPEALEPFSEMKYNTGYNEILNKFEQEYGVTAFTNIGIV